MAEDLKRGSRLGDCELLLRIGRGGMATVWVAKQHAKNPDDERLVAIKAILPELSPDQEFVKMFLDEGRLVRSIKHPNVVQVYDVSSQDGIVYLAMEWVEGDSLHTLIAEAGRRRPIPAEMAVRIVADAANGLAAAHALKGPDGQSLGVVHRDVSPHNILIGTDGTVRLVDFGVAKAMGRISDVTVAGQLKGKFGYMSPEQARAKTVDQRSDIFSLGTVLFELTTGRRLFRGEHDAETLKLVTSGEIPKPTSVDPKYPPELEVIVLKALQRDPRKRYQSANALREDLEAYLKSRRIVVARAGIAALLKRVLGPRIEERRDALRSALAGGPGGPVAANLISADAAFAGVTGSGPSMPSGVSGTGASGISIKGAGAAGERISGTPSGVDRVSGTPSSRSGPSLVGAAATRHSTPTGVGSRWRSVVRYAILGAALVGLAVAGFALRRKTTTTTVTIPAAGPAELPPAPAPRPTASDNLPTTSLDKLRVIERTEERHNSDRDRPFPRPASSSEGSGKKPGPAASAGPATAPALPRENPY
jgi:eukaryotic-like serine/threonine-protein kinase